MVTRQRRNLFAASAAVKIALEVLSSTCLKFSVDVPAYCFMPDHLHLLVVVPEGGSLKDFVRQFKQLSGYALKKVSGDFAWQVSYYDHVLRREEAILDVARYIWDNPVKEGLVSDPRDFPYSGPRPLPEQI
jgi:putative transposase